MRSKVILPVLSLLILSACMVTARPGGGVQVIPILPAIVEVDSDNYYPHAGYHYFYTGDRWYYSSTRDGQRNELPRSHWPRETHRYGWNRPN
jgi:hypothetical protein